MSHFSPAYFFDLSSFEHAAVFDQCTTVWEALVKINSYLLAHSLGNIQTEILPGVHLISPETISIGKGTVIEPGAYIKGPCVIGEDCTIRHGAYIRGDLICGNNCVIGHDTEVKNAIFLNGAQAAHFAYVGDSILGNKVNLGAGTKCANLKFDHTQVTVLFEGQRQSTGLRKFGAIIGDRSQIGCNVVTNPGTLIGKNVACYPTINVGGFIPSNCVVKSNVQIKVVPINL